MLPFAMPDVSPVANDDGGSPVGVGVETAVPAPEYRLALAVLGVPVSATRAGLGRALRRDGDGGYSEFGGFLAQQLANMADGRFREAFVQFAFGLDVLAWCDGGASGRSHHADGVQAFDGDHLRVRFQQYLPDLPAHFLVAALGVLVGTFAVLGNGVLPSFAVTGFAGDMALVFASALALFPGSGMVGAVSRAEGQVVLAAAIRAEHVFRTRDIQLFKGHGLWHGDLHVQAVMPAVQRCAWSVVLDWDEPYGADVQKSQIPVAAQPDREATLATGEGLTVVADLEKPAVGDGQAAGLAFSGAVRQGTAVGTHVAALGFLIVGDGICDALESCLAGITQSLVGFPGFLGPLLVNVIRRIGLLTVGLPPGGDPLVHGVGVVPAAAFGQFRLTVEHVNSVVIGGVLLRGAVADGPAVGRVVAHGEFQGSDGHELMLHWVEKLCGRAVQLNSAFLFVNIL